MHGEGPKSQTTGVFGWESLREENALIHLARQIPTNGTIVELGGEYGRSASQFAYAFKVDGKQGHVYTVDIFPLNHPVVGNLQQAWYNNITEAGFKDYCTSIRGTTLEGAVIWHEHKTPIDLLFIDAGHTYEDVWADITAWSDFVKQGGVMAFHDYAQTPDAHPLHWEVKRAVDEWYEDHKAAWTRYSGPDSLVWFVRVVQPVTVIGKVIAPREDKPSNFVEPPVKPKNKGGRPPKTKVATE